MINEMDIQAIAAAAFSQAADDNGITGMIAEMGELNWLPRDIYLAALMYCNHWYGKKDADHEFDVAMATWQEHGARMLKYGQAWRDELTELMGDDDE